MIEHKTINSCRLRYLIADPINIDLAFGIGGTVKSLGAGADAAINFSYADTETGTPIGRVIIDGKTVIEDSEKTKPRDELYMLPDKSIHIGKAPANAIWAVQGSPPLLRDGKNVVHEGIQRDQTGSDIWQRRARRTAAGISAEGKVIFVSTQDELFLGELADLMLKLGCVDAHNGDGGGSSYFWPADTDWGRKVGAAITIKEGKQMKPILIIDPGHGGRDPGGGSNNYFLEKDKVLDISLYQFARFKELGVPVSLTRDKDIYLSPDERTRIVRESGARYCISNHINAGGGDGAETIYSIYSDDDLAKGIADAIKAEGQNIRRTFTRTLSYNAKKDYYYMHRDTGSVQTVIVEYGFADSKGDDVLQLIDEWKDYAEAAVKAFCKHIGHPYTVPAAAEQMPTAEAVCNLDVNGQKIDEGYIINGRAYVPARALAMDLGAKSVNWDGVTRTVEVMTDAQKDPRSPGS